MLVVSVYQEFGQKTAWEALSLLHDTWGLSWKPQRVGDGIATPLSGGECWLSAKPMLMLLTRKPTCGLLIFPRLPH